MLRRLCESAVLVGEVLDDVVVERDAVLLEKVVEAQRIDADQREEVLDVRDQVLRLGAGHPLDQPSVGLRRAKAAGECAIDETATEVGGHVGRAEVIVQEEGFEDGDLQLEGVDDAVRDDDI